MLGSGRLANTGYLSILPGRPGHRTYGRSIIRPESHLFRSGKYREAGNRRRFATLSLPHSETWELWHVNMHIKYRS